MTQSNLSKWFGKKAAWRVAANQIWWMITEPRVARIRLACLASYYRAQRTNSPLTEISEADFRASRKSDRVFIFGSGWSLNELGDADWRHFEKHDTFGFSMFVYQEWVRTDYHLFRELYLTYELDKSFWYPYSQEFAEYLDTNEKIHRHNSHLPSRLAITHHESLD